MPLIDLIEQLVAAIAGLVAPVSKAHTTDLSQAASETTSLPGSPTRLQVSPVDPLVVEKATIHTWLKVDVEGSRIMADFARAPGPIQRAGGNVELELTFRRVPSSEGLARVRDKLNLTLDKQLRDKSHG